MVEDRYTVGTLHAFAIFRPSPLPRNPNQHDSIFHFYRKPSDLSAFGRVNLAVGKTNAPTVVSAGDLVVVVNLSARKRRAAVRASVLDGVETPVFRSKDRHDYSGMRNDPRGSHRQIGFFAHDRPFRILHAPSVRDKCPPWCNAHTGFHEDQADCHAPLVLT